MYFKQDLGSDYESHLRGVCPAMFAEYPKETVSDRYLMVPTYKIIRELVDKEGFRVVGASQSNAKTPENRRTAKHIVHLTHDDLDSNSKMIGTEVSMLSIIGSHGGQSSWGVLEKVLRKVCMNGMYLPKKEGTVAKVRHVKSQVEVIKDVLRGIMKTYPERMRQIADMKDIQLSRDEQVMLAEAAQTLIYDDEQIALNNKQNNNIAQKLLFTRRTEDRGTDLWTSFNVIQENVIKGGVKIFSQTEKNLHYAKTRPITEITRSVEVNQKLMQLALLLRESKR